MIKKVIKSIIPSKFKRKIKNVIYNQVKSELRNTEVKYKIFMEDKEKLDGKIAIITGASGAIGSAISFRLAMEGAIVIACGRNKDNLKRVEQQIKNNGGQVYLYELDVTNNAQIEKVFDEVKNKFGRIDILVNNAGGSAREKRKLNYEQDIKVIREVIEVNLIGTIMCSRKVSSIMVKQKYGKIINIGSVIGKNGLIGYSEYAAAKSGIEGFTKSLAIELAQFGINVNCVSPGQVNQVIFDRYSDDIKTEKNFIGRTGKTDEVANAVEFFCRDESEYIIGQNLIVDGGRSLGLKGS